MIALVQLLQALSGVLWLAPALVLSPRVWRAWHADAARSTVLWAPVCFVAWVQAGFTARWLLWPRSLLGMGFEELLMWASLYGLSCACAAWILGNAWRTR